MYSFEGIMRRVLAAVSDGYDKREGSLIYDALAPAAAELAQMAIEIQIHDEQTYLLTATGESLDNRAADFGAERYPASYAVRIGEFCDREGALRDIDLGRRFATPNDKASLNYTATARLSAGRFALTCESPGTAGNEYYGDVLPLTYVSGLGSATIVGTQTPARDVETDEEFRERVLELINRKSFGGNRAQYREEVRAIAGVGDLQIYPVWNGGGTVLLSVVDADYLPITEEFRQQIAKVVDPENNGGQGLGFAPIGHRVAVKAPETMVVNVDADLYLYSGATVALLQTEAEEAVERYLDTVRRQWGKADEFGNYALNVFNARVAAALLEINGVNNVKNLRLNGLYDDMALRADAQRQQLPVLGEVRLHAAQ